MVIKIFKLRDKTITYIKINAKYQTSPIINDRYFFFIEGCEDRSKRLYQITKLSLHTQV